MPDKARLPHFSDLAALPGRAVDATRHPRATATQLATVALDNARWGWRLGEVITRRARARASSVLSHLAESRAGGMGTEEHLAVALHDETEPQPAAPVDGSAQEDHVDLDDPLHLREADTSIDRAAADLEVEVTPLDVAEVISHGPDDEAAPQDQQHDEEHHDEGHQDQQTG